eukprot:COSAG06_NODE_269_length_18802_cov_4323.973479_6_plen_131_part_00
MKANGTVVHASLLLVLARALQVRDDLGHDDACLVVGWVRPVHDHLGQVVWQTRLRERLVPAWCPSDIRTVTSHDAGTRRVVQKRLAFIGRAPASGEFVVRDLVQIAERVHLFQRLTRVEVDAFLHSVLLS